MYVNKGDDKEENYKSHTQYYSTIQCNDAQLEVQYFITARAANSLYNKVKCSKGGDLSATSVGSVGARCQVAIPSGGKHSTSI